MINAHIKDRNGKKRLLKRDMSLEEYLKATKKFNNIEISEHGIGDIITPEEKPKTRDLAAKGRFYGIYSFVNKEIEYGKDSLLSALFKGSKDLEKKLFQENTLGMETETPLLVGYKQNNVYDNTIDDILKDIKNPESITHLSQDYKDAVTDTVIAAALIEGYKKNGFKIKDRNRQDDIKILNDDYKNILTGILLKDIKLKETDKKEHAKKGAEYVEKRLYDKKAKQVVLQHENHRDNWDGIYIGSRIGALATETGRWVKDNNLKKGFDLKKIYRGLAALTPGNVDIFMQLVDKKTELDNLSQKNIEFINENIKKAIHNYAKNGRSKNWIKENLDIIRADEINNYKKQGFEKLRYSLLEKGTDNGKLDETFDIFRKIYASNDRYLQY